MIIHICFEYFNHDILFIYHSDGFFNYSFQLFLRIFDLFYRIQINQSPILVGPLEQLRSDLYNTLMMKNKYDLIFCFRWSEGYNIFLVIIAWGIPFYPLSKFC